MLEKLSPDARSAVVHARSEAVRLASDHIGCEHLLLGLLDQGSGTAAQALAQAGLDASDLRAQLPGRPGSRDDPLDAEALASLGIDLDAVRRATSAAFGPAALDRVSGPRRDRLRVTGGLKMTRHAKTSLASALRTAGSRGSISSGHILLAILDQPENAALNVLRSAGIDPAVLRADVARRLAAA
jgi:ATP-dependent Clp protease ATP-binding subunit ClpA